MSLDTLGSGQLLFSALVTGAVYAIVAVGLNLVYGTMRLLNVAHGDLVMIGAYLTYGLLLTAGMPPLVSLVAVAAVCAAIGLALYRTIFRRLLAAPTVAGTAGRLEENSLLLFFGLSIFVQNLVAYFATSTPRAYQYLDAVYRSGDIAITGNRLAALVVATAICVAIAIFLRRHVFGLALRAVIDGPVAARIVGVDVDQVHRLSFMLGFASAGVAGVLVSMMEQFSPFIGFPYSLAAFIVIILGGLGNIAAGFAAALVLGFVETYGIALTSPNWRSVLLYGVFVATLVLLPQGLFTRRAAR